MLLEKERKNVVEYGKRVSLEGLTSGTSGNISIFNKEKKLVAISPSGISYLETKPEDVVILDLDGNIIDGDRKPSSEKDLHLVMYKNKNCGAVVHTHSKFLTVFACLHKPLEALHYIIADSGSNVVPVAEYRTFGSKELAISALETIGFGKAVLLANHGALTIGNDIKSAFSLIKTLEEVAELQYRCMSIGRPKILSKEEIEEVIVKFGSYGQKDNENKGYN